MKSTPTIWGVHMGRQHGTLPIATGYVAIGWPSMGDLTNLPADREAFKRRVSAQYPDMKPGAIPGSAGVLFRFAYEMQPGDLVVYPSKRDRMVNIGELGDYRFDPAGSDDPDAPTYDAAHYRSVRWLAHRPRTDVPQAALNEIGSAITLFLVANNPEPFLAAVRGEVPTTADEFGFEPPVIKVQCKQVTDTIGRPVVQQLMGAVTPSEFGLFVTLGGFSAQALDTERTSANLRLIDGQALTDLVFQHYDRFEPQWQAVVPLKRRYVPGAGADL